MGRNTWIYITSSCPWEGIPGYTYLRVDHGKEYTYLRVVHGKSYLDIHIFELAIAKNTWIYISWGCPWQGIPGYTYLPVVIEGNTWKKYLRVVQGKEYLDIHIFELSMGSNTWIYISSSCQWDGIPGYTYLRVVYGKEYLDIHIFELSMARNTWIDISSSCPWQGIPEYTYLRVAHGKKYLDIHNFELSMGRNTWIYISSS